MQDIKVTIDGKEQTLTEEQIENISKMFQKDAWERKDEGGTYYTIFNTGEVVECTDTDYIYDGATYKFGNYYPTKHIAEMRSLDWQLNNLLFRYSMQHGGENITDETERHYIYFSADIGKWYTGSALLELSNLGTVYFATPDVAEAAIREVVEPFCRKHHEYLEWLRGDKQ